jgi:hypothetical protein
MAPHRALGIAEVLGLIFDELRDNKVSLVRSAQTCKSFLDPALNVLWRRMNSPNTFQGLMSIRRINLTVSYFVSMQLL